MILYKEIESLYHKLNGYQKEFLKNAGELFFKIPQKNIGLKSNVRFDIKNNMLEITLVHSENPEMLLLFIIHEDMIEIWCSEYVYYLDSMKNALFFGLQKEEFYYEVKEFVKDVLNAKFKLISYSYNGKKLKSEIIWKNKEKYDRKRNYYILGFLHRRRVVQKTEVCIKSFMY